MDHVDCVVAGAGVVGLAIARALARDGRQVLVIDAADGLGAGTSGRGSGVVHAGLYYEPSSLKARLCVAGRDALYAFAKDHGVPHHRLGKLVVATSKIEAETLAEIASRAKENGVLDLERLSGTAAGGLEPELRCCAALLSPSTGIIDALAYLRALQDDAESFGAVSAFRAPLVGAYPTSSGFALDIGGAAPMRIGCRVLVNAAGHGATALARSIEGMSPDLVPRSFFAKGNYFALCRPVPFKRLIYPVPVPGGVGIHLTIGLDGTARFGPDVEWVEAPDDPVDAARAASFYSDIRRWWPGLADGALTPAHAGIRPKISAPGQPGRDFLIDDESAHNIPGLVNLFGIESPGLTASLAIGDHVAGLVGT